MILRIVCLIAALSMSKPAIADTAPDITWVQEGYNFITKLPCQGCPFLYQDTSTGENAPWTERQDNNALLLNISLPYDSAFISINDARIYTYWNKLPIIHANQVVQDLSKSDLQTMIDSNQLEVSHETETIGGAFFGLSYTYSLNPIEKSAAMVFQFDVTELYSDLPERPLRHKLADPRQEIIELVLLQTPVQSALEPPSMEIIKASLVPRSSKVSSTPSYQKVMHFEDWDTHGKKGTTSHLVSSWGTSFLDYLDSGIWAIFVFLLGIIALFVVVCLFCIFGCDWCSDDYEKAQHGKARKDKRRSSGRSGDLEMGKGRFKSAEELGLLGRGKVVGVGKSD